MPFGSDYFKSYWEYHLHFDCCCCCLVIKSCQTRLDPWTAACQASLSLSPRVCSDSCPLSWWCYLTISSSATPFSFCLQSFPESGSFSMINCSHRVAKALELQLKHQSFQWVFKVDFLSNWLVWSPCCPRGSQESSSAPQFIRKHQFFSAQPYLWSNPHTCTWLLEKP